MHTAHSAGGPSRFTSPKLLDGSRSCTSPKFPIASNGDVL